MEFWKNIKEDIRISRKGKIEKKRMETLTKFFDSTAGKKHFEDIKKEWNIQEVEKRKVEAIDNDYKQFRLVIDIENDNFIDIIRERKPETLKYRITNQFNEMDNGDLLIEVNDKIALKTFGILFPQTSGIKGIFDKIPDIRYTETIKDYPGFQPWRDLVLNYPRKK